MKLKPVIELRSVSESDMGPLLKFMKNYHISDNIKMSDEERLSRIQPLLARPEMGDVWLVSHDNLDIGYVITCNCYSIEFGGVEVWLDELYVGSEYRGHGYGSGILREIKSRLKDRGVAIIHLEVNIYNTTAQKLYRKHGFLFRERFAMMSHAIKR